MHLRKSTVGPDRLACAVLVFVAGLAGCNSDSKDKDPGQQGTGGQGGGGAGNASADWKMLGYDLASTFWNKGETILTKANVATLTKAWEFDTTGGASGTPVISGGKVYIAAPAVRAIDLASGTKLWENLDVGGTSSLALDGDTLYLHDGTGVLRALDVADGTQRWEHKGDENPGTTGFSSAIVAGDLVLAGGSSLEEVVLTAGQVATFRGYIVAVNKADGTLAWKKHTVEPPHTGVGLWSTVSANLEDNVVIGSTGNNYTGEATDTSDAFLALPLDTGADFLWKAQILEGDVWSRGTPLGPDGDFGCNPVLFEVGGRKLAAGGAKMGDVMVVDRTTGEIIKQRNLGPTNAFKGGVFVNGAWDGQRLLFAVNGATSTDPRSDSPAGTVLFALDPLTLDVVWERGVGPVVYSWISVANGVGFYGKDKILEAFDTETGDALYTFETEATIATAPAVSNGYVVFGSGMSWVQSTGGNKYYALKVQ